jgi:hypothetical protein
MEIKNFLVVSQDNTSSDPRNLYRPNWLFRLIENNDFHDTNHGYKKFQFDALLGTPSVHRNYVMARFQNNPNLLNQSIVTYRNEFKFSDEISLHKKTAELLNGRPLLFPYVSQNLNPVWEQQSVYEQGYRYFLDGTDVPWDIYRNTWYSICTESGNDQGRLFPDDDYVRITEKTARLMFAKRVFIMFGSANTLAFLRRNGFKTFSEIIDERYDLVIDAHDRFSMAFDQVELLSNMDPVQVYQATAEIREHNYHRLYEYRKEIKNKINQVLLSVIPPQYCN